MAEDLVGLQGDILGSYPWELPTGRSRVALAVTVEEVLVEIEPLAGVERTLAQLVRDLASVLDRHTTAGDYDRYLDTSRELRAVLAQLMTMRRAEAEGDDDSNLALPL